MNVIPPPSGALASCVNEGVVLIKYAYESTSLSKLLQLIGAKLKGRPALSIALLVDGSQTALKLCSQKVGLDLVEARVVCSGSFIF